MTNIISTVKMAGRPAIASCLPSSSVISAAALRGSGLRGTGLLGVISERPTQASAALAAQAYAYAPWANGAGLQQREANSDFGGSAAFAEGFAADGNTTVATQHHRKMRAFRGLKPWRDPA
ncbi:hypothetical protein [Streptantibioticus ferralitis]|uniref:Uncharacterized protein n=1 Tax=Streptantibioticus ferralitis TaxID=236510 RepID=A0ABT5YSP8_9ACTN|nr:hypothetical protein [Streptantibioticus ferralitis]MDF2254631.1 hypothetical protein [Streptantibioticus ferralitis]